MKCPWWASGKASVRVVEYNIGSRFVPSLWKVNNETCAAQVYNAIESGYRLFDGACGKLEVSAFRYLMSAC